MSEPTLSPLSSFVLKLGIPLQVPCEGQTLSREDFYGWLWEKFGGERGLQGVHEGTLLTAEAAAQGLETESWTVDAAEAPRERDWLAGQPLAHADLYFASAEQAHEAREQLARLGGGIEIGSITEQKPEDWDAQWKAAFLGDAKGVKVPPFWRILPPWVSAEAAQVSSQEHVLRINPGAGFGTGTHETTQLCLEAIGETVSKTQKILDFGCGSGILAIGAALLGGQVYGVEIDPLAIDNAGENARLNGVDDEIEFSRSLEHVEGPFAVVIANILKPVLLEFAPELVRRLDSKCGRLILSGLIEADVEPVVRRYSALLGGRAPVVKKLGEWRALVW